MFPYNMTVKETTLLASYMSHHPTADITVTVSGLGGWPDSACLPHTNKAETALTLKRQVVALWS